MTKTSTFFPKVAENRFLPLLIAVIICLSSSISVWAKHFEREQEQKRLSLKFDNKSLKESFTEIEKVSQYVFFYPASITGETKQNSFEVKNETIENVLDKILASTKYIYKISEFQIFITERQDVPQSRKVGGHVTNESGEPLAGVTVAVINTSVGTYTDADGRYSLEVPRNSKLRFSYVGYSPQEIEADKRHE